MVNEVEGYEVSFSETTGDWYIVHCQWKGSVFHRNILAERYESEEAANEAADACAEGEATPGM